MRGDALVDRFPRESDGRPRAAGSRPGRGASAAVCAGLACLATLACTAGAPSPAPAPAPGSVRGHVAARAGAGEAPPEPMLVFLEPLDGQPSGGPPDLPVLLRSTDRGLEPPILATGARGAVRFENDASIYHHLFSYSESNPFDLGLLRRGETRSLALRGPGVVRIYCKLHPGEGALLFVAPSEHFTVFEPPKPWEIVGVPPGRYRVGAWGETWSAHGRTITVRSGASVATEIAAGRSAASE